METESTRGATANAPAESRETPTSSRNSTRSERDLLVERANQGDAHAAIELIRLKVAQDPPAAPAGIARVKVRPPRCEVFPAVPRRLSEVDAGLAETFAALCAGEKPWPLFIHGPVGCGKSMAGLCFADVTGASYTTLERACDETMDGHRWWTITDWRDAPACAGDPPPIPPEDRFYTPVIVDELGERSKVGDLAYTTLKGILDCREFTARRTGIYISNLPPSQLASLFDIRIVSRLTAGTVCKLTGQDRRRNQ